MMFLLTTPGRMSHKTTQTAALINDDYQPIYRILFLSSRIDTQYEMQVNITSFTNDINHYFIHLISTLRNDVFV